jgi:thymidylate synthase ThyX
MKLRILVKNKGRYHCFDEEEFELPDYPELTFRDNVDMRKSYVEKLIAKKENFYQHYLEDREHHFELLMESKVAQELAKEESKLKIA